MRPAVMETPEEGAPDPAIELSQTLDAWQRSPSQTSRMRVRHTVEKLAARYDLRGIHLTLRCPPLPELTVGVGDLRRRPGRNRRGLRLVDLRRDGHPSTSLGTLAVSGSGSEGEASAMAAVVCLAVEAARARAGERGARARLAALDDAARAVNSVLALERVLQLIVDRVRMLVDAQYAALGIVDHEGLIERFVTSGISRWERERIGAPPRGHGILGLLVREQRSIRIRDIRVDPRRFGFPAGHPDMRAFLGVPVVSKGHAIGNLYLTNKNGAEEFSLDDQALVEQFAGHAAIAMENARLLERVQRLAIVEERERIGQDLHDGIIQSIYAVGLSLEDVPELMGEEPDEARDRVERAITALDMTIRDIRNFIFGLRPELLEGVGLSAGLAALADEFRVNTVVDMEIVTAGSPDEALDDMATAQLLSIAREALSNVARHARASRVTLAVSAADGHVRLVVTDNGGGFDVSAPRNAAHQGLSNMRARANSAGGVLQVESEAGQGTRIIVSLPAMSAPSPEQGEDRV